ncbi:T9SS type A sorting domain-containing protein [Flavobacteriaceae bacterium]|nr:T9SS type A sorting domain-containing protein [Flavobacteriaceae bacterium]
MKNIFTFLLFAFTGFAFGQVTVTSDVTLTYNGYMNVHNLSNGSKDSYNFGQSWGVGSLKTTITTAGSGGFINGAITLQPNFNGYADNVNGDASAQAFWTDGAGGGNKWMEAITYVEYAANTYPGGDLTFKADVNSNTLDNGYTVVAFIKTLKPNNNHAVETYKTKSIGATGTSFTVSATSSEINTAHIVQYGFTVEGINANQANESALGSVIITPDTTVLGGSSSNSPDTAEWDFETATTAGDFPGVGDGAGSTATVSHVTTGGNPNGALKFGGTNDVTTAGKAYQVQYSKSNFNYANAASAKLTFDMKIDGSLTAAAVHNHFETKGPGTKSTFNLEGANKGINNTTLNNSTYTSFEVTASSLTGGTGILRINFEISAGAVTGGGGLILLDNVAVELFDSSGKTLGLADLENLDFVAYPNPMGSQLTVEGISEVQHASIFDLTGREVLRAMPNKAVFTLDTADLQHGVYMLSLQVGDSEITKKLMK